MVSALNLVFETEMGFLTDDSLLTLGIPNRCRRLVIKSPLRWTNLSIRSFQTMFDHLQKYPHTCIMNESGGYSLTSCVIDMFVAG
jgi:hypothetical protein